MRLNFQRKNKLITKLVFILLILIFLFNYNRKLSYNDYLKTNENKLVELKRNDRLNACIIILGRNSNLFQFIKAIKAFEKYFNHKYNYPYIFFNNVEFDDYFRLEIKKYTNSTIEFEKVSPEAWNVPEWIDRTKLDRALKKFGYPIGYHQMCRFFSGFFFRQRATLKYDYYMRLDAHSYVSCEIEQDPFIKFENDKNFKYGFASSMSENIIFIEFLWDNIIKWLDQDGNRARMSNYNESMLNFISADENARNLTSLCMFYNNVEIGSFSLFRSQLYLSYFDHLDKSGGFFYHRWGDAPVHTYYVLLMLKKSQVHLFTDILYDHRGDTNFKNDQHSCLFSPSECESKWLNIFHRDS